MLRPEDLDHLCRLARLRLPESERSRLREDLDRILHYVESLNELDTSGVADFSNDRAESAWRPDLPGAEAPDAAATALRNAPLTLDGHFAVPGVLARDAALGDAVRGDTVRGDTVLGGGA